MCGLYSKLLNARLMQVVEKHDLLGEIQNGFRPNRSAADNNFILSRPCDYYQIVSKEKPRNADISKIKAKFREEDVSTNFGDVQRE